MAKQKKTNPNPKAGLTDLDQDAETTAIDKWLRMMDKPLAKNEGDEGGRHKQRRVKRRGK